MILTAPSSKLIRHCQQIALHQPPLELKFAVDITATPTTDTISNHGKYESSSSRQTKPCKDVLANVRGLQQRWACEHPVDAETAALKLTFVQLLLK